MSNAHIDPETLSAFLDEADQCLSVLGKRLLEAEGSDGADAESVDEMFRAAHTLKGAAGFLGLESIQRLTHTLESLLDQVRKGRLEMSGKTVEPCLKALDGLQGLLEALRSGSSPEADVEQWLSPLNELLASEQNKETDPEEELGPLPECIQGRLTVDDVLEILIARRDSGIHVIQLPLQSILGTDGDPLELLRGLEGHMRVQTVIPVISESGTPWRLLESFQSHVLILAFSRTPPEQHLARLGFPAGKLWTICLPEGYVGPFAVGNREMDLGQRENVLQVKPGMEKHLPLWLSDTRDQLEKLDRELVAYEQAPEEGARLAEIFRMVHSIKGSSNSMGFLEMGRTAHNCESILASLRSSGRLPDGDIFRALFSARDFLQASMKQVEEGATEAPDAGFVDQSFCEALDSLEKQDDFGDRLEAWEPAELREKNLGDTLGPDESLWKLGILLDPSALMADLRYAMLLGRLEDLGKVIVSKPSREELESGKEYSGPLKVLFAGSIGGEALCDQIHMDLVLHSRVQQVNLPGKADPGASNKVPEGAKANVAQTSSAALETIRVETSRLDSMMNIAGELSVAKARVFQVASVLEQKLQQLEGAFRTKDTDGRSLRESRDALNDLREAILGLNRHTTSLQSSVLQVRMVPIGPLFQRFHRLVRDLAKDSGRKASLITVGENTELDKKLIDELGDPLTHLIRNAVDHGLESPEQRREAGKPEEGKITLEAFHQGGQIGIRVRDDGKGLDIERIKAKAVANGLLSEKAARDMPNDDAYQLIFKPGFSTAASVTNISGRGVGMDIVKSKIQALKGRIELDSQPGQGCTFTIRLPLTLALIHALLVRVGGTRYAIPMETIKRIVDASPEDLHELPAGQILLSLGEQNLPVVELCDAIGAERSGARAQRRAVLVRQGGEPFAIPVDQIYGQQEIVVKSLSQDFSHVRGVAGATILGDGAIALILDVGGIRAERSGAGEPNRKIKEVAYVA